MKRFRYLYILFVFLAACFEQRAVEQLREGRGLTIYLEPRSFTPTKPTPLTPDQLRLVQKSL